MAGDTVGIEEMGDATAKLTAGNEPFINGEQVLNFQEEDP